MKCPNCKFENPDNGAKLCTKCKYPINLNIKWNLSFIKMSLILIIIYAVLTGLFFVINLFFTRG